MIPNSVETDIQEFLTTLVEAGKSNLDSVVLYGSASNGEFHEGFSNVNLLCVVRDTSLTALEPMKKAIAWWCNKQKQPAPLIMTRGELEHATDVFAIELLDMKNHHRVLFGDDVIGNLNIPMKLHRVQVEYELREKTILLRQRALLARNDKDLLHLLMQSVPSFATLCRHALIALQRPSPVSRRAAITELATLVSFDASAFIQVLDVREKKSDPKKIDVKGLFAKYLASVEKVTAAVDEAFDR